jgi:hypothetical protein
LAWSLVKDIDAARSGLADVYRTLGDARAVLVLTLSGTRAVDTASADDALRRSADGLLRGVSLLEAGYRHARTVAARYGSAVGQSADGPPWTPASAWREALDGVGELRPWQPLDPTQFLHTTHLAALTRQLDQFVANTRLLDAQLAVADSMVHGAARTAAALGRSQPPRRAAEQDLAKARSLLASVSGELYSARLQLAVVTERVGGYHKRISVSRAQMWRRRARN